VLVKGGAVVPMRNGSEDLSSIAASKRLVLSVAHVVHTSGSATLFEDDDGLGLATRLVLLLLLLLLVRPVLVLN